MADYVTAQGYDYPGKVANPFWDSSGGGGGGTYDYNELENKPSINGVELVDNKTSQQLSITPTLSGETLIFN